MLLVFIPLDSMWLARYETKLYIYMMWHTDTFNISKDQISSNCLKTFPNITKCTVTFNKPLLLVYFNHKPSHYLPHKTTAKTQVFHIPGPLFQHTIHNAEHTVGWQPSRSAQNLWRRESHTWNLNWTVGILTIISFVMLYCIVGILMVLHSEVFECEFIIFAVLIIL